MVNSIPFSGFLPTIYPRLGSQTGYYNQIGKSAVRCNCPLPFRLDGSVGGSFQTKRNVKGRSRFRSYLGQMLPYIE